MNNSSNIIRETVNGYSLLSAEDILMSSRKIFLTQEVNPDSCDALLKNLMALNEENSEAEITLYINSPGGCVHSGLAVFDYIRFMKAPLRTVCVGTCASMGAILFLAGDKREIAPHGRIMIHDPSYGSADIGGKKPHEIQKQVDKLMETKEALAQIISNITGKPLEEIYELTKEDTFFNAKEACEYGLATSVIGEEPSTKPNRKRGKSNEQ